MSISPRANHGVTPRTTSNITMDGFTCPGGAFTDAVEIEVGATNCSVFKKSLDGTFSGLVSGSPLEYVRNTVRKWLGSYRVNTLLVGKDTADATTGGARIISDGSGGYMSIARSSLAQTLNRLTTSCRTTSRQKDAVEISADIVNATTAVTTSAVTAFTLNTRATAHVIVTGSYNDGGTVRRFYDLLFFAFGLAPVVLSAQPENSPAARTYNVVTGANLTVSMASGTYQVRAAGSTATINE